MMMLTIMIGVVLETFANLFSETRRVSRADIEDFREAWRTYDPNGTSLIASRDVLPLLRQAKFPLGFAGAEPALTDKDMLKHLGKLDIPDHGKASGWLRHTLPISLPTCSRPFP